MTHANTARQSHPNTEMLRDLYTDLTRLGKYADDDMVLHAADRKPGDSPVLGKTAALNHERELIRMTANTLLMDVEHITANDHFGAVLGVIRAQLHGQSTEMPFCGLWRFRDGRIIEHWENAYDADSLGRFLAGNAAPASA